MRLLLVLLTGALAALVLAVALPYAVNAGKPGVYASPLWAVVNVDGTLARGSGVVSSRSLEVDGQYEVIFNRDVSQCAFVAVGGEANDFPADDSITFGVSTLSAANPNGVFLQEFDGVLGYDAYSSGFHLIVSC